MNQWRIGASLGPNKALCTNNNVRLL